MATKVQIVFDCADPARAAASWEQALHCISPSPPPPHESWDDWARAEGIPMSDEIAWMPRLRA